MRYYETMFVVKPTLTEDERLNQVKWATEIISKNGGEVAGIGDAGVRQLAYTIRKPQKFERGHYFVLYFTGEPQTVLELERQMRYNEDILRFMTVKYETKRDIQRWEQMVKNVQ
jgi:small subunit ribosomal protein S6